MPDLTFRVEGVEAALYAAAPLMVFKVRVTNRSEGERVHSANLQCRVELEATRRVYDAAEQERLLDLFDRPERWGRTVRRLLWAEVGVAVLHGHYEHGLFLGPQSLVNDRHRGRVFRFFPDREDDRPHVDQGQVALRPDLPWRPFEPQRLILEPDATGRTALQYDLTLLGIGLACYVAAAVITAWRDLPGPR